MFSLYCQKIKFYYKKSFYIFPGSFFIRTYLWVKHVVYDNKSLGLNSQLHEFVANFGRRNPSIRVNRCLWKSLTHYFLRFPGNGDDPEPKKAFQRESTFPYIWLQVYEPWEARYQCSRPSNLYLKRLQTFMFFLFCFKDATLYFLTKSAGFLFYLFL